MRDWRLLSPLRALALASVVLPAAAPAGAQTGQPFTAGIDACDNVAPPPAVPRLARYDLVTGVVELPLVFAPGLGWFRATLDPAPAGTFRLRAAEPVCELHPSPASFLADTGTLHVPEVEAVEAGTVRATYEAVLRLDAGTGLFHPLTVWNHAPTVRTAAAPSPRRRALDGEATVPAVLLDQPVGFYAAGDRIPLSRIAGGRIGAPEAGCEHNHLHGTITIDGSGPYVDPKPGQCGFGVIVTTDPLAPTSVVPAGVPAGTQLCGPDITKAFFGRLRIMAQRLAALPATEKGLFDGTLFLARNGGNMDFETGAVRDPAGNPVCPTEGCSGDGHTSTFTLCGRCMISHVDNDIEYGVVAQALGVPRSVQLAGAHAWDLFMRQSPDPLPSQAAYAIGNLIGAAFQASPAIPDSAICLAMSQVALRTGVTTWTNAFDLFAGEMAAFGKQACQPCPHGCPEALVRKDFATQAWDLDNGGKATYTPPP